MHLLHPAAGEVRAASSAMEGNQPHSLRLGCCHHTLFEASWAKIEAYGQNFAWGIAMLTTASNCLPVLHQGGKWCPQGAAAAAAAAVLALFFCLDLFFGKIDIEFAQNKRIMNMFFCKLVRATELFFCVCTCIKVVTVAIHVA